MGRKAPIISLEEFRERSKHLFEEDDDTLETPFPYELGKRMETDLSKVIFDRENAEHEYTVLKNKLPVLLCWAGGDWEEPVHFIIYWDGKQLRAYIPNKGNTFHPKYKAAFGSWQESPQWAGGEEPDENPYSYTFEEYEEDIIKRIEIQ